MCSGIIIQFGMKSGDELLALTGCNNMTVNLGQHFTIRCQHFANVRRTDEGHGNVTAYALDGRNGMETA